MIEYWKKFWYYVLLMNSEIIAFEDCRILWTISLNRVKEYWYIWKYKCIWIKEKDWKQSEKKKYRIPSRNSFTFLQSETLLVNEMQWMIIIPKWQLYFSDKTFQHFKNRIYIWLILESIHKEEKRIWNTIILIVSPNQSSVHKVLLIRIFHCFFMKRFFRSL